MDILDSNILGTFVLVPQDPSSYDSSVNWKSRAQKSISFCEDNPENRRAVLAVDGTCIQPTRLVFLSLFWGLLLCAHKRCILSFEHPTRPTHTKI